MTIKNSSRQTLWRLLGLAWARIRNIELSLLFVKLLTWLGGLVTAACVVLYIITLIWNFPSLEDKLGRLNSNMLGLLSALFAAIGFLYSRQRAVLDNIRESINSNRLDLMSILANMNLFVRSGSIFTHCAVIGDDTRLINDFSVRKHDHSAYISMHSEVLYYSALCSLLEHWKDSIRNIWRAHAFFPDTPTAMFLPELLDIVSDLPTNCRAYLFRNDVLDYDRQAMHDRPQQHLWPTFVKASRVLFRDQGARYGFLEPKSPNQSIWWGRPDFRSKFEGSYERILIELCDGKAIACVVDRDLRTSRFRSAKVAASGGEGDQLIFTTRKYFDGLLEEGSWEAADDWQNHGLEVAIVSGEEMEIHAAPFVTLWAVDDFPISDGSSRSMVQDATTNSWQAPGSSRDIAWRKTVVAALKGSKIQRVFLVDPEIFERENDLIALFVTMAVQHRFLTQNPVSDNQVRLLVKNESHKRKESDLFYPDLAIMVRGVDEVLGGVIVHPQPEYIRQESKAGRDWLTHVKRMWQEADAGGKFPHCFLPGIALLANNEMKIIDAIAAQEERDSGAVEDAERRKNELGDWLANEVRQIKNC